MNMISPRQTTGLRETRGEDAFGLEELVISRTDGRGILQAFNDVFLRVAGLTPSEAMGAPYKSVRHDEMPSAIYHTIWQRLNKGLPAGAYLKNRAKGEGSYWVFAIIVPSADGGFASVQLKPCSEHFDAVRDVYAVLRKEEKDNGVSPEQSAAHLMQLLSDQ